MKYHGLGAYLGSFIENGIDVDVLKLLNDNDLSELGLSLGDRKRFYSAVDKFQEIDDAPRSAENKKPVTSPEAEHRNLTILFSDMVGSTQLSVEINPEALREITRMYQDFVSEIVTKFGGYVARYMGDGVLAYFGYPKSHEDDPKRAVRAAVEIIEKFKSPHSVPLLNTPQKIQVSIGIETGPVIVGDVIGEGAARENPVVGKTPNLAARIEGIAMPDTVLVGPGTKSRLDESINTESMGFMQLKGVPEPLEIWRVLGTGLQGTRFDVKRSPDFGRFIGRAAELEILDDCWADVLNGKTEIVEIRGDAGIGKSRLVYEFLNSLRGDVKILQGHCISHGASTAFLPFRDMLQRQHGISDGLSRNQLLEKIQSLLDELQIEQSHSPYLLKLFGITLPEISDVDMELAGLRTREAIIAFILAHAQSGPLVIFVNDLHWIDDRSEVLLQFLIRQSSGIPFLLLSTTRPEFSPEWGDNPRFTCVSIGPLSSSETTILMRDNINKAPIDSRLLGLLLERAGGNPLFAEQLVRHAVENRLSQEWSSSKKDSLPVPETLESLLLQRVDLLSKEARRLLQAASVSGRWFRPEIIGKIIGVDQTGAILGELESHGLIRADYSLTELTYGFRHALVYDAVYGSLLTSDKHKMHMAIGSEMERRYQGREIEVCEDLARHFSASGDITKSTRYCGLAGDKALGLFAISDARSWYAQSLERINSKSDWADDSLIANIIVNQLEVLCFEAEIKKMVELAEMHTPLIERQGHTYQVSRMFSWLGEAYLMTGRFSESRSALEKAINIAEELKDQTCLGYAIGDLLWLDALTGHSAVHINRHQINQVLEIAENNTIPYLNTLAYYAISLDLAQRGYISNARKITRRSIEFGEKSNYPPAIAWAQNIRAFIDVIENDSDAAVAESLNALDHASCRYDRIIGEAIHGFALVLNGRVDDGIKVIERVRPEILARGVNNMIPLTDIAYGMALSQLEPLDRSLKWFRDFEDRMHSQGNHRVLCFFHLVFGEFCLVSNVKDLKLSDEYYWKNLDISPGNSSVMVDDAEKHLKLAFSLGEKMGMHRFTSNAASKLAALRIFQNRDKEADDLTAVSDRLRQICSTDYLEESDEHRT